MACPSRNTTTVIAQMTNTVWMSRWVTYRCMSRRSGTGRQYPSVPQVGVAQDQIGVRAWLPAGQAAADGVGVGALPEVEPGRLVLQLDHQVLVQLQTLVLIDDRGRRLDLLVDVRVAEEGASAV